MTGNKLGSSLAEIEKGVSKIWQSRLGVPNVSPEDDFFELGGTSLCMLNVIFQIKTTFGVELPYGEISRNTSLRKLSLLTALAVQRIQSPIENGNETKIVEGSI
jgi:acyl carrier protein